MLILLIMSVSLFIGIVIGSIIVTMITGAELKETEKELDKFRGLYFNQLDQWKDKYVDKTPNLDN